MEDKDLTLRERGRSISPVTHMEWPMTPNTYLHTM